MLPILYSSSDFILYSYPLLMGLGWGVGYQLFMAYWPEHFPRRQAQLLFWGIFIFAWIGAKALFLMTLPSELSVAFVYNSSFWTGGGFVFYGGFIGGVVFMAIYKLMKLPLTTETFWPIVPAVTFGHAIGRIGCLLAGCCYGKPTNLWWGIFLHGTHRHPTQLIEAICLFVLGVYLLKAKKPTYIIASDYLMSYALIRFGIEMLRGDLIRGEWGPFTPSQWISLFIGLVGLLLRSNDFRQLIMLRTKIIK